MTVLIEPRALVRECIALSLTAFDPTTTMETYPDVAAWARDGNPHATSLILFCSSVPPGGALSDQLSPQIAAAREIAPDLAFAVFAAHDDPVQASEVIRLGARGYLSPGVSLEVTVHALKLIRAGGVYVPANLLGAGRPHDSSPSDRQLLNLFSPRELEVARAMRKGQPNKVIAVELNMSESTVKVHVRNIIKKLKVKNRTEVAFRTQGLFLDGA
ncbi:LuxR C-terminal-related transcriptional regulator [Camelimonas fluminis]|uniref:LuxR C-terminal-related transcriptional regulator n=1 Tax=Camelimonas fluminis TaxID=1576911 RepID=A0ABV7UNW8_9HYPH|nr:response regulator transcription factor [Camelimonas fluminis]